MSACEGVSPGEPGPVHASFICVLDFESESGLALPVGMTRVTFLFAT